MIDNQLSGTQAKFIFSGHESFQCRHLWLKKGYDLISSGKLFTDEDSVVFLGVGKNMVSSIRFWMRAFGLTTQHDELTPLAHAFFSNEGFDPYLEDEATIWILHYMLIHRNYASTYSIIFNELRREKIEFTKDNFISYLKRKAETEGTFSINEKTLIEDFSVFSKMYLRSSLHSKDREDSFSGILTDLDLVKSFDRNKEEFFVIENSERNEIPSEVILFALLNDPVIDRSVNFSHLENGHNSICSVFALNRAGLLSIIEKLANKYSYLVFNDQAGIKEIQFKKKPKPLEILEKYYGI